MNTFAILNETNNQPNLRNFSSDSEVIFQNIVDVMV